MPTLVYRKRGRPNAFVFGSQDGPISIGRNTSSVIVADSPGVSRHHAEITTIDDGATWVVTDQDSANGTFVNGERVKYVALNDKDVVGCGDFLVEFRRGPMTGRTTLTPDDSPRRSITGDLPMDLPAIESLRVPDGSLSDTAQIDNSTVNLALERDITPLLQRIAALEARNAVLADEVLLLRESLEGFRHRDALSQSDTRILPYDQPDAESSGARRDVGMRTAAALKSDRLSRPLAAVFETVMDLDRQRNAVIERLLGILVQEHDASDDE